MLCCLWSWECWWQTAFAISPFEDHSSCRKLQNHSPNLLGLEYPLDIRVLTSLVWFLLCGRRVYAEWQYFPEVLIISGHYSYLRVTDSMCLLGPFATLLSLVLCPGSRPVRTRPMDFGDPSLWLSLVTEESRAGGRKAELGWDVYCELDVTSKITEPFRKPYLFEILPSVPVTSF